LIPIHPDLQRILREVPRLDLTFSRQCTGRMAKRLQRALATVDHRGSECHTDPGKHKCPSTD